MTPPDSPNRHLLNRLLLVFEGTSSARQSKIFFDSFGSFGLKLSYIALQFTAGVLLARLLGPSSLGVYAFIIACVQITCIAAQFGTPAFLVRTVASQSSNTADFTPPTYIVSASLLSFILCIVLSSIVWSVSALWSNQQDTLTSNSVLFIGTLLTLSLALSAIQSGALRGFGRVLLGQVPDSILRPTLFTVALLSIYLLQTKLTPITALSLHAAAALIALFCCSFIVQKSGLFAGAHINLQSLKKVMFGGFPFLLLAASQVLNYQIDIVMLGLLASQTEVGLYRVAVQVVDGLSVPLFALSIVVAPIVARLQSTASYNEIQNTLIICHRAGFVLTLGIALPILLFGESILPFVFGASFSGAADPLEILTVGKLLYSTIGFSGLALSMTGRAKMAAILTICFVLANLAGNYFLIPLYGTSGAAASTAASLVLLNICSATWLALRYGLRITAVNRRTTRGDQNI